MNRKALFAGAALVLILVGYFIYSGFPPGGEGAEGTIGGVKKAQKYRVGQISANDVILTDTEIQKLLQNDKIQELLNDDSFRKVLANASFHEVLANVSLQ